MRLSFHFTELMLYSKDEIAFIDLYFIKNNLKNVLIQQCFSTSPNIYTQATRPRNQHISIIDLNPGWVLTVVETKIIGIARQILNPDDWQSFRASFLWFEWIAIDVCGNVSESHPICHPITPTNPNL